MVIQRALYLTLITPFMLRWSRASTDNPITTMKSLVDFLEHKTDYKSADTAQA